MKGTIVTLIAVLFSTYIYGQSSVEIGNQVWTSKNLDVTKYRNGDKIPEVKDPSQWNKLKTGAWCYYNNDPKNGEKYGKLYNWYAVNDPRGLAPNGWHIPTDKEWETLVLKLGQFVSGGKMKESGTSHWQTPNTDATNSSGFLGLPGGQRFYHGKFLSIGTVGSWWSTTEYDEHFAWGQYVRHNRATTIRSNNEKRNGFSVRCIKD